MTLATGTRFGSYEITSLLGAGGMGEVYRARDTNLKRDVAIKVLPVAVGKDTDRLARFQREAELLAVLNHPNIAQIYGLERSNGATALVMELVPGQSLVERLAHGPLSVDEALVIARQIADALEAAHERGIVHRDLKPANVQLAADGTVKVLDFGIAKALDARALGGSSPAAVTTPAMTEAGIVLGTAAYASPEQARGQRIDQRTDIWSFGCVLYELLTGRLAFGADDVSVVLARVLERPVDFDALPKGTPPAVRRTLELCLEKDARRRIADIRDVKLALAGAFLPAQSELQRHKRQPPRTLTIAAMGIAVVSLSSALWLANRSAAFRLPESHVEISTPATISPDSFAVSPDGRQIAYTALRDVRSVLWVRSLDTGGATVIEGTDGATRPFWSPDSRSIGFFQTGSLKVVDLRSGAIRLLTSTADGFGGDWNGAGELLFSPTGIGGVDRMAALGGERTTVTAVTTAQRHVFPKFLPNGRDFLFYAPGERAVHLGSLDDAEPERLLEADGPASYAVDHLFYVLSGRLLAVPFDVETRRIVGDAVRVEKPTPAGTDAAVVAVSVSPNGTIAYRTATEQTSGRRLAWFDRDGRETAEAYSVSGPFDLDFERQRLAVVRTTDANPDIWLVDLRRGASSRFTTAPSVDAHPVFSPSGERLIYQRFFPERRRGDIYWRAVVGGDEEPLLETADQGKIPTDVSGDGRWLLYKAASGLSQSFTWDIWALPLTGPGAQPQPVVATGFDERDAQFSPDGKWILYQSNESGQFEVYLQPFGRAGERQLVSAGGGAQPRWRADGREIFYVSLDSRLTAVGVEETGADGALGLGKPQPLFLSNIGPVVPNIDRQSYLPSADGQQFLMSVVETGTPPPLNVILNFDPERHR